jgi:hypothetical protein
MLTSAPYEEGDYLDDIYDTGVFNFDTVYLKYELGDRSPSNLFLFSFCLFGESVSRLLRSYINVSF